MMPDAGTATGSLAGLVVVDVSRASVLAWLNAANCAATWRKALASQL